MAQLVMLMGILFPVVVAAAYLLGRHLQRRQAPEDNLSAVTLQHLELFHGGQLSEKAVEAAKRRFRGLLERGEVEAVEAILRPGTQFAVHVRALTEIGTDDAGHILERQLGRRLSDDQMDQSWYWIDVAGGLRSLNREESLPHLLRCADAAGEMPLGHFYAAETICFLGFSGYLTPPDTPLARRALRVLHRALEGLRSGVPPQVVAEARLGELIERVWDECTDEFDPLLVRIFAEALRQLRRAPHTEAGLAGDRAEQEAFRWQMARLAGLEETLVDFLTEAPLRLTASLAATDVVIQEDTLLALRDLRAEAGAAVMALLETPRCVDPELAVDVLTWSRDARVGPWLRDWALRQVPVFRRAQQHRRPLPPTRRSLPAGLPYQGILRALRGHPSAETEAFLLLAARDWDPTYRAASLGSLGWWEPLHRRQTLACLQESRHDPNPEVRQQARAALARLGERRSLQWFRHGLSSEDPQRVHEAVQVVAVEGLTLLWPDLDRLADASDADVAHHAREALERLCENMDGRTG